MLCPCQFKISPGAIESYSMRWIVVPFTYEVVWIESHRVVAVLKVSTMVVSFLSQSPFTWMLSQNVIRSFVRAIARTVNDNS